MYEINIGNKIKIIIIIIDNVVCPLTCQNPKPNLQNLVPVSSPGLPQDYQ